MKSHTKRIVTRGLCAVALAALWGNIAEAQVPSWGVDSFRAPPDIRWQKITHDDVEAAFALLRDNHPGAAPELRDAAFQNRLTSAHQLALSRAGQVTSYQGYSAVLAGFATAMGDKHIWSRPTFLPNLVQWPGFIVSKRGKSWIVTDTDGPQASLKGASLVSCDGQAVDDFARAKLGGFRAVWSIGAQQIQSGPWLLVDEGNPFVMRPRTCVLQQNRTSQAVTLDWQRIKRDDIVPRLHKAIGSGAAGFGVRRVGNGYWIAVERLIGSDAVAVVKAVDAQKDLLRKAPFIVLDLRGNGGGDSGIGREIAEPLMGHEAVAPVFDPGQQSNCPDEGAWRASRDNVSNAKYLAETLGPQMSATTNKALLGVLHSTEAAYAAGRPFSVSLDCKPAAQPPRPARQIPSLLQGQLIVVTDSICFSSCLLVTQDFRALGARHVGQTTDADTHFMDVREQYLPSGYSMFSTLEAVDLSAPEQVGPFEPDVTYDGDIANTAALEKWIETAVVKATPVHGATPSAKR